MKDVKSCVPGFKWPAIPDPNGALMLALQYQFEQSEKLSSCELRALQFKQAESLLYIAKRSVPLYKDRIPKLGSALTQKIWNDIPVLTRAELVDAKDLIINKKPLQGHDQLHKITTSGSTGIPITAYGTPMTRLFWDAFTLRDHLWQKRDLRGKLVSIRPEQCEPGKPIEAKNWGSGTAVAFETGPAALMNSRTDIADQLLWLQKQKPDYLLSLPSILNELARCCIDQNIKLSNLKQIRTYGELLTDAVRDICQQAWGVAVVDTYSAQEVGYIAMQCPEHGNYHVQSESLLVEILDENDKPCAVGETGRVVVTTLLNFGAPLIRYAIGDYAQFGEPCACGRGLPVIQKIMGRQRNMMRTPDGRVHWPSFPSSYWNLNKIKQMQLVQLEPDRLLIRLVVSEHLDEGEEETLKSLFVECFQYEFLFQFEYLDAIPRSSGGKFEDFVCLVD